MNLSGRLLQTALQWTAGKLLHSSIECADDSPVLIHVQAE